MYRLRAGCELWLGHPFTGRVTIIDAQRMRLAGVPSFRRVMRVVHLNEKAPISGYGRRRV
jgi:hypothetical protein